ncbi:acyl-CoA thioesterase [Janthinobacterium sp. BJB1]|nr:acyl-CoA thioesterase [Janthinobacterium sp. GW458P]PJD00002.1 acyl-CoA thioesterase [Janthinobacterium sp. BJB1]
MHHTSREKTLLHTVRNASANGRKTVQSAATVSKGLLLNWDFPHACTLPVSPEPADIDGLQHTNNAVYVRWCEHIAWHHSATLGLDLDDYRRLDRAMAIRRGEYDYLLPTRAGEALTLATWLCASDGRSSMERRFQLVRDSDGATVVRGRWHLICIELSSGRARRLPPEFLAAYEPAVVAARAPARD